MKRWFLASLALNMVLVGLVLGFFLTSALPLPFNMPLNTVRPGFEEDLQKSIQTLSGEGRVVSLKIFNRNFKKLQELRVGSYKEPRPEDLLKKFRNGTLPDALPFRNPKFVQQKKHDMDIVYGIFKELSQNLNLKDREQVADFLSDRISHVKRCIEADDADRLR